MANSQPISSSRMTGRRSGQRTSGRARTAAAFMMHLQVVTEEGRRAWHVMRWHVAPIDLKTRKITVSRLPRQLGPDQALLAESLLPSRLARAPGRAVRS